MFRLLSETEKNTSWVPYEKYFMTQDKVSEMFAKTKSSDEPVTFTREELGVSAPFAEKLKKVTPLDDTIIVMENIKL